ncbi:MAG: hypothetical protein ACRDJN_16730, partial [Chloroflexota bacterium]
MRTRRHRTHRRALTAGRGALRYWPSVAARRTTQPHPVAAGGYAAAADAYEQGRPDYPPDAIACLVEALHLTPGARVLDLGAGTG